jgi:hypothetical protein
MYETTVLMLEKNERFNAENFDKLAKSDFVFRFTKNNKLEILKNRYIFANKNNRRK